MKICLDKDKCILCGSCSETCPDVFKIEGDKVILKKSSHNGESVKKAAKECPAQAISISEK